MKMKKIGLLFGMAAILTACGNEQGQSLVLENSTTTQSQEVDQQTAGDQASENSETEAGVSSSPDASSEASGASGASGANGSEPESQVTQGATTATSNSQEVSQSARRGQESQADTAQPSTAVTPELSLETDAGQIQEKTETEQTVIEEIADRLDRSVEGVFYFGPVEVTSGVFEVEVRSTNPSDSNTSNLIGIYRLDRNSDTLYELDYATGEYVEVN